uniref:T9SS type A sorting domain-containing protein n=1 Tax=Psychroserpens mesophilus TaxID=325473 RepID=UPI003D649503
ECERDLAAGPYVITVDPAPEADVTAPEFDSNIACSDAAGFTAADATYSNGLEGTACEISGSIEAVVVKDYTACGGTITITYNGKDECERDLAAGPYVITVDPAPEADVTAPQFPLDIECVDAAGFTAADATYSNGLEETACEISGSIEAVVVKDYTVCGGTITITYNSQDECDRDLAAGPFVIEVKPAPAPVFNSIEDDSIACEDLASYVPETLGYSNGIDGDCGINGSVQGVAEPFDGSCGTFEVNFSYESCGVTINASQTITVIDETAPILVGELPQGLSDVNACLADAPAPPTEEEIEALFTDNCGNVNATLAITSPEENTDCLWAVLYRYTIQDDCGNFAAPVKIYHNGGDRTAPELVGDLPEGVTGLQCLSENPGAPDLAAIEAAYTDNCGDVIVTPFEPNIVGDDCGWTATYEYEIKDTCGNKLPNLQIVNSGADTMAPELEGEIPMGMNTVNACKDADLGEPTEEEIAELFSDNCTDITADNVTKIEKLAIGSDCEWIRVFEYIVKDDCNNAYPTFKINYQGGDSEGPMATGQCTDEVMVLNTSDWDGLACPEDATISLETGDEISVDSEWTVGGIPAGQIGSIYGCYTDNCTAVEDLAFTVIGINEDKGTCSTTLTITFDVEDSCGNKSADPLVCTFIINDTTAPVLECPAGEDFGVVTETPEFADKASWTDNCQGSGDTADYTDSEITEEQGDVVYVEGDYVFTFQAGYVLTLGGQPAGTQNDNPYYTGSITTNGNPSPQYGTFEVVFNSTTGEYDVWQDFGDGPFVAGSASADAFETCDPDNWYFIPFNGHNKAFTLECPLYSSSTTYTLVRTFTANDGCGNIGECDVTYTWTIGQGCDDVAPVLDCPAGQDFGIVQAAPTTFDTSVPFTDNNGDGVTTNFTDVDTSEQYFGESTELSIGCIEDGELFAVVNFVRTGFNSDGIAEYATGTRDDAPQFSYELVYDSTSSTWITEEYENGVFLSNIWYSPSTDNAPSCNPAEWDIDSSRCDEIFVDCGFAELDYTEYTKTRTFTATDACDNEASCDVVYTWVIDNEPNFRDTNYNVVPNSDIRSIGLSGSQEESNVDFRAFPVPFDNEVTITYEFDYRTDVTIELFDTKGLLVTNITNGRYVAGSTGRTKIDLSKTPSQVLYVKLTTNQGSVTKKIVSSGKN